MLESFGNIGIDIRGIDSSLQAVDRQGAAAGLERQGADVHHVHRQCRVAFGQDGADDAGATAKVEQLARHGREARQQHLAAEIQAVGAEDPRQCHDGQLGIPGLALIAAEPGIQLEGGDRLAELAVIEGAAAGGVAFYRLLAIGGQQLVGPVDAAPVLAGEEQVCTAFEQRRHHGQQILRLGLGLGHQQQQGIEARAPAELVIEQDALTQGRLLAAVIAVIRGEDRQGVGQLGQLTRVIILQGTTHQ